MKSKKAIVFSICLCLMIGLFTGCGNTTAQNSQTDSGSQTPATEAASTEPAKQEPVTLRVWGDATNQTVIEKPFQSINDAFMKKYPNIKVQFDIAQNNDTLQVALQSNSLPDCIMVQGDKSPVMAQMATKGYIMPLDGKIENLDRYSEMELNYTKVDGKVYCSPSSFLDTCLVYYNKDIFQKQNLSIPNTWDEFLALNDKLLASGITPISYSASSDWDNFWPLMALAPDFGNDALTNIIQGNGTWSDPSLMTTFNHTRELAEKGYYGKNYVGINAQGAQLAFTNGKAAMIIDGTWNNTLYSKSGINLGHFFIPNDKGEKIAQTSLSNFMTYSVATKTKYPDEAITYVNYLASQEAQQIMEDELGMVPTLKDITPNSDSVKEMSSFDKLGWNIYAVGTACASDNSKPNDIILKEIVPKLATMKITGQEACDILDKASTYPKK